MLSVTVGKSISAIAKNIPSLKRNLKGDIYAGYTPDWRNFLQMSRFCADSLPADAVVLSRKPSDSFLYAYGKKFEEQFSVSTNNADSVLMILKSRNIHYAILASLRRNPLVNDGRYVTTIHKLIEPVSVKYPDKIHLIKVIGDDEYSLLYKIDY
jgi:hypothetical protein